MSGIRYISPTTKLALERTEGALVNAGENFPFVKGAYRLVKDDNYTDNFGFQWNKFAKTQIDRFQKHAKQSLERFMAVTHWNEQDLKGVNILEVGSGAGRFSQIVLEHTAANLYSVDYSNAVEANAKNNGPHPRLHLFQASIYELPFASAQFDKVFCFGVLQHTPDFKKSVSCLIDMVKPGGELIVDFYPIRGWYTRLHAKYLLRPFTRKLSNEKLLKVIERNADRLINAYRFFDRLGVGKLVNRFLPVCDIKNTLPPSLDATALREWVILDTFDMFSPAYDNPQPLKKVKRWFTELRMKNVQGEVISYGGGNSVTVVKGIR